MNLANTGEKGDIDLIASILLIVVHQFDETWIIITSNSELTIILTDKGNRLAELVLRESHLDSAEIELRNKSEGNSLAMNKRKILPSHPF